MSRGDARLQEMRKQGRDILFDGAIVSANELVDKSTDSLLLRCYGNKGGYVYYCGSVGVCTLANRLACSFVFSDDRFQNLSRDEVNTLQDNLLKVLDIPRLQMLSFCRATVKGEPGRKRITTMSLDSIVLALDHAEFDDDYEMCASSSAAPLIVLHSSYTDYARN